MWGLLYDIHGNLPALEAVLADAGRRGADGWLLGGDYAAFGAWPAETVERLRELRRATWIRGNTERWLATRRRGARRRADAAARSACRAALGDERVDAARRAARERAAAGDGTRVWHASPVSDMRSFAPEPRPTTTRSCSPASPAAARLRPHPPAVRARRRGGGVELVNPGCVGMPFDGDHRAAYALLDDDGAWSAAASPTTTPARRGRAQARAARRGARSSPGASSARSSSCAERADGA